MFVACAAHTLRASERAARRLGSRCSPHARPQVALDVARALVYLHARRIVHLDLKSANVLLTRWDAASLSSLH